MRRESDQRESSDGPAGWLRRVDQAVVAVLVAASLLSMGAYCSVHAWKRERLIEIDRQPQREAAFVVDVNQADWPELCQIPEIGETLARRIVELRQQEGPYRDLNDLLRVRGIGPRTLEKMRPHLMPIAEREMVAGP
jgi:competence protein ComEA